MKQMGLFARTRRDLSAPIRVHIEQTFAAGYDVCLLGWAMYMVTSYRRITDRCISLKDMGFGEETQPWICLKRRSRAPSLL